MVANSTSCIEHTNVHDYANLLFKNQPEGRTVRVLHSDQSFSRSNRANRLYTQAKELPDRQVQTNDYESVEEENRPPIRRKFFLVSVVFTVNGAR
jgi:hypothetical protein